MGNLDVTSLASTTMPGAIRAWNATDTCDAHAGIGRVAPDVASLMAYVLLQQHNIVCYISNKRSILCYMRMVCHDMHIFMMVCYSVRFAA